MLHRPTPMSGTRARAVRDAIVAYTKENSKLSSAVAAELGAVSWGALTESRAATTAHTRYDSFLGPTETQHNRIAALTAEVTNLRHTAVRERRAMGGIHAPAASLSAARGAVAALRLRLTAATAHLDEVVAEGLAERMTVGSLRKEAEIRARAEAALRSRFDAAAIKRTALLDATDEKAIRRDDALRGAARVTARVAAARASLDVKLAHTDDAVDSGVRASRAAFAEAVLEHDAEVLLIAEMRRLENAAAECDAERVSAVQRVAVYDEAFAVVIANTVRTEPRGSASNACTSSNLTPPPPSPTHQGAVSVAEVIAIWTQNEQKNWALVQRTAAAVAEHESLSIRERDLRTRLTCVDPETMAAAEHAIHVAEAARNEQPARLINNGRRPSVLALMAAGVSDDNAVADATRLSAVRPPPMVVHAVAVEPQTDHTHPSVIRAAVLPTSHISRTTTNVGADDAAFRSQLLCARAAVDELALAACVSPRIRAEGSSLRILAAVEQKTRLLLLAYAALVKIAHTNAHGNDDPDADAITHKLLGLAMPTMQTAVTAVAVDALPSVEDSSEDDGAA